MATRQNLFDRFLDATQKFPQKTAILYKASENYTSISYQEIFNKTIKLFDLLKAEGIKPYDKVGIILDNQPEYAYGFFAVMATEATAVPMDTQLSVEQIRLFIVHAQIGALLVNKKVYARLKDDIRDIKFLILDDETFQKRWEASSNEYRPPALSKENDLAVLFYTSGTTDLPKAVMLSHQNLLSNVDSIWQLKIVTDQDRVIAFLPLHHTYAFTVTLLTPLFVGATIAYPPSLNSTDLIGCLKDNKITIFVGVPQVFSLIHHSIENKMKALPSNKKRIIGLFGGLSLNLRQGFGVNIGQKVFKQIHESFGGSLRFMVSGGARLDPEIAKSFIKWGFTILEGYGLTETSPVSSFNLPQKFKIGSVGKSLPNVEVKVLKEDSSEKGEVIIKGPNVMQGYYLREDKTKEVLKDGWFYTGDLGYIDQDGFIFLVGRKKEIIVLSNGKNIYPEEIEKMYGHNNAYIKEMAVLTKVEKGALGPTEHLVAAIVINEDHFREKNEINVRERLKWEFENVSAKLPSYKRIMGFVISKDPLPRTRLGKIMRYQLPALYTALEDKAHAPRPKEESTGSHVDQKALECLREILQKPIQLTDHLELDLGLDSLSRIELLLDLQERLHLELSEDEQMEFFSCNTVSELQEKLQKHLPQTGPGKLEEKQQFLWKKILLEEPSSEFLHKIKINFNVFGLLFNIVMISFLKFLFMVLFFLRSEGRHHLPPKGPYLICPNHSSYLDGLFVLCALPYKIIFQTYFVGLSAFFEHFTLRPFTRLARLIPIEINVYFIEAMKTIAYVLKHNKIVCYFPEGQRSIDGEVKEFKKGVGILIKELEIPVVPVYLEGSYGTWSRGQGLRLFSPVKVKFGKPVTKDDLHQIKDQAEVYESLAEHLREKVINLKDNR